MLKAISVACLALIAATASAAPKNPAAEIEAAERAFAADGLAMGIKGSFLKHMADDAIVFEPTPVSAKIVYAARSARGEPKLEWWPAWIVASRSGDVGLSIGPAAYNGKRVAWYASLWRREADGRWRWIYDGGGAAEAVCAPGAEAPAVQGPLSTTGEASRAQAFDTVRAAEATLSRSAQQNAARAYGDVLSTDARLLGPRGTGDLTPTALAQRLTARPATMSLTLRGGGASRAGDLVWTHGEATWDQAGQNSVQAHYMHVWQRRPEGWRLIFETLINDR